MALSGIQLSAGILVGVNKSIDAKYGPYPDVATAKSDIGSTLRYLGLTVGIITGGVVEEYWWESGTANDDLVVKGGGGGGAVDSVNGQTGVVVLDADDIDDALTTNKFTSQEDINLLYNIASTGILDFDGLSINVDITKFDVGAISAWFVDNSNPLLPTRQFKSFVATTANSVTNLATQNVTYIAIDSTGALQQSSVPFEPEQQRDWIPLGVIVHSNRTSINAVNNQPVVSFNVNSQLSDLMESIGFFNISGNIFTPNGVNLNINKSAGHVFKQGSNFLNNNKDPHTLSLSGLVAPSNIRYRLSNGTEYANTAVIDPNFYELAGVRTAVPGGKFQIQRIYLFQSNLIRIQYGQEIYGSLAVAIESIATEPFIVEQNILENGLFRGLLIVKQAATDLTDTSRAAFIEAAKFGSVAGLGSLSTTTLQQAYNNSVTPEIVTDSTLGAVSIKRGSAADTDIVFETLNAAGTVKSSITGDGDITVSKLTTNGDSLFNGNITISQPAALRFVQENGVVTPPLGQSTIDAVNQTLTFIATTTGLNYKGFAFDTGGITNNSLWYYNMPNANGTIALTSDLDSKANIASPTFTGTVTTPAIIVSDETADTIASFDASKNIKSLPVASYPDLTELSYVKGTTSTIQTQLNGKQATLTNPITGTGTGTTNKLPKFTGTSALGDSQIFDNGTNVGINTIAPVAKLHSVGLSTYNSDTVKAFRVSDSTTITKAVDIGFDAVLDKGFIQAANFGIQFKDLAIQPNAGNTVIGGITTSEKLEVIGTFRATRIGLGAAANLASYLNVIANTTTVGQIYFPPSAVDYTGTLSGMLWNNTSEWKFYDGVLSSVNRLIKLNGNSILANANPLNVVTSTGTGGNLGTLKAEVSFSRYPTAVTYTMLLTDVGFGWVVAVTDTSASRTINLPVANTVPAGWQTTIKDESGGAATNAITVSRSSTDTIEGATSRAINTNYGVLKLYSDGVSKWFII